MAELSRFQVAVIGAGPAGLMAADVISAGGGEVTVYDRMPSVGRKFLMAGRGGLNLTHSEDMPAFLSRYGRHAAALQPAIEALPPATVRAWCEGLGQLTFVGTSGRVFPTAMKTSPLLRAWLQRLTQRGVVVKTRHRWAGWDEAGLLRIEAVDGPISIQADATVLALGGASWPGLGTDGAWVEALHRAGIEIAPLQPANCGFCVAWSGIFRDRFEGQPIKRVAIRHGERVARGELICTARGLEGGAIYALSAPLRDAIAGNGWAVIEVDLKPDIELTDLIGALDAPRRKLSLSSFLRKALRLSAVDIGLLQEAAHAVSRPLGSLSPGQLAALIKAVPVRLTAPAPVDRAISTAGGVAFSGIDSRFMLSRRPGVFVAGEMLDWEAPTGGYLLQGCFSTGAAAGHGLLEWWAARLRQPRS